MNRIVTTALGLAAMAAIPLMAAQPAHATPSPPVIQLGFILDSSGSIGATNWGLITSGLANAINTFIPIVVDAAHPYQYEISVVKFGTTASTVVDSALITDAASRTAVANAIAATAFTGGNTDYTAAFTQMNTLLNAGSGVLIANAAKSYINFATDGVPNPSSADGITVRNTLIAEGVDNISIEGIGGGVNAVFLQNSICYPGPCTIAPVYNFDSKGFYIAVNTAADYAGAIAHKIQIVTGDIPPTGIPEPASLAVLGFSLLGLGMVTRRRAG